MDPTFGTDGMVTTGFIGPVSRDDSVSAALVRPSDGKVIVAGASTPRPLSGSPIPWTPSLACYDAAGHSDAAFGDGGQAVLTDLTGLYVVAAALDADGRILIACRTGDTSSGFVVARVGTDGRTDRSFGTDGRVTVDFAGGEDVIDGIAVQSDGKIIAVGAVGAVAAVARLNSDGSLDTTFDGDGMATVDFAGTPEAAFGVTLLPDGRIVLGVNASGYLGAAALNPDGSLDGSFGQAGRTVTGVYSGSSYSEIGSDGVGRVVLTGTVSGPGGDYDFAAVRLTTEGVTDSSFGESGVAVIDVGGSTDRLYGSAVLPDGGVLLTGHSDIQTGGTFSRVFSVARLTSGGSADASFGVGGSLTLGDSPSVFGVVPVAAQADGKVLLAGSTFQGKTASSDIKLYRLNADGTPDDAFAAGGVATTDFSLPGPADDLGGRLVPLSGGRVLAVGSSGGAGGPYRTVLVMFHRDGSFDTSFGDGGRLILPQPAGFRAYDAIELSDGKLLLAGMLGEDDAADMAVVRLNADGTLDATFGASGLAAVHFAAGPSYGAWLTVLPDGRIVIVGGAGPPATRDFAVARLTANGDLDGTFGSGGVLTIDFDGSRDGANDAVLLSDGRIVLVGTAGFGDARDFAAVRITADGSLDPTFGSGGRVRVAVTAFADEATAVAVRPDGRLVLVGGAYTSSAAGSSDLAMVGLTSDGGLDATFGAGGIVLFDLSGFIDRASDVVIQPDGRILTATVAPYLDKVAVIRFRPDGSFDGTFGTGGRVVLDSPRGPDTSGGILLEADGRILVSGGWCIGQRPEGYFDRDLFVARLLGDFAVTADVPQVRVLPGNVATNSGRVWGVEPSLVTLSASVGAVTLAADGSWNWSYTPTGPRRSETVALTATYGGETTRTTFVLVVTARPVAAGDLTRVREDAIAVGNLLANDSDADGDPLVVAAVNGDAAAVGQTVALASGALLTVNADGTFTYDPNHAFDRLTAGRTAVETFTYTVSDGTGGTATAVVRVVVYGAGQADLVGYAAGGWHVGVSTGSAFATAKWAQWSDAAWAALRQGDFDADGRTDVLGLIGGAWYVGVSTGAAFVTGRWGAWSAAAWKNVLVGDLNGDGKDDVLASAGGAWYAALSTGSGFAAPGLWGATADAAWTQLALADVTGDGRADLVLRLGGAWYVATSTGSAFNRATLWTKWADATWAAGLADLDGDGRSDAWGLVGGAWYVGRSTGSGFATGLRAAWNGAAWKDPVAADFDGDGRADLAARLGGQWWVGLSGDTGSQRSLSCWGSWADAAWKDVRAADFDGDGKADLAGRLGGGWYVARGTGARFVTALWGRWADVEWQAVAAAEVTEAAQSAAGGGSLQAARSGGASASRPVVLRRPDPVAPVGTSEDSLVLFWSAAAKDDDWAERLVTL